MLSTEYELKFIPDKEESVGVACPAFIVSRRIVI